MPNTLILDSIFVCLTLYPCWVMLRRMGLPIMALAVLPLSLIIPLLGHTLFMLFIVSRRWPALPTAPKPVRRKK